MPKVSDMIHEIAQSRFLKKEDVGQGILVTISSIEKMNIAKEGEPPDIQYVMRFVEVEKPLVMKSTNLQLCVIALGTEDTDLWHGKKIVLYTDPNVSYGNKLIGGIRIRAPRTQPAAVAPPPPPPPAPAFDDDIPF